MSSANDAYTPKTTITSLPTELLLKIVRLSSPKPSWDTATERFKLLRSLALVCRAFRGLAQEELFRHVVLPSLTASRAFVAVLESREGARFASTPRSLRVGKGIMTGWTDQNQLAIPFIVKRCSRIESMWLLNVDGLDVAAVTSGTDLKALFSVGCQFIDSSLGLLGRTLEAGALTRLGINYYSRSPRAYHFTNIKSLDIGTPLSWACIYPAEPSWDNAVERSAHLRTLALVCRAFRGPAQDELFRNVVLRSAGVEAMPGFYQETMEISVIIKRCSRLESMWLLRILGVDVPTLTSGTASEKCSLSRFINSLGGQLSSLCTDSVTSPTGLAALGISAPSEEATIASLATELIIKIVRLSSPKPSWDNATERSAHLRNLALVCQVFREPAQEELFRHVVLRSVAASRLFVDVLKSDAGARFASTPRSLRVCSRLQSMWLLVIHSPDIVALVSGTDLKELFCFGCSFTIVPHGRGLEALQLTRLGIRHCYDSSFLDPTSFPNVKSLDVSLPGEVNIFDQYMFANSLGGQLSALCIGEADAAAQHIAVRFIDSDVDPSRFKNLLILDSRLGFEDVRRTFLSLEHVRYGTADGNPAMSTENAKALEDELKGHRPDVRLSFDEDNHLSRNLEYGLIDAKFNPSFWAFVDDAEAAEEAKRRDSEGV
ncbi:hypothetical protein RQP46_006643 [Phenoliferia psychrophenolica]